MRESTQVTEFLTATYPDADPNMIRFVEVVGDSMAPEFRPGDRIAVDVSDCRPSPPGVFVFWDGLGFLVRRLEYIDENKTVNVRVTNPAYMSRQIPLSQCDICGRVIGKWVRT